MFITISLTTIALWLLSKDDMNNNINAVNDQQPGQQSGK
jgi:hypothetical protein